MLRVEKLIGQNETRKWIREMSKPLDGNPKIQSSRGYLKIRVFEGFENCKDDHLRERLVDAVECLDTWKNKEISLNQKNEKCLLLKDKKIKRFDRERKVTRFKIVISFKLGHVSSYN